MAAWNARRRRTLVLLAAATGSIAILLGANGPAAAAGEGARTPEKIYASTCGYCHGHNIGPIIRGRGLDADTVAYFVRHGSGAMPAFKPTEISNSELAALGEWIAASDADPKEHGQ